MRRLCGNETLPYTVAEEEEDYSFCKVCDDSFSVAKGMLSVTPHGPHQSRTQTHRGIEQTVTTNSSVRQFFPALSKTANSKAVSVTRADVMLCQSVTELIRDRGTKYSPC